MIDTVRPAPNLARLQAALTAAGIECIVVPARPDADPVERLRAELAGMYVRGVPLYRLPELRRAVVAAALRLVARATRDGEVPLPAAITQTPGSAPEAVDLARDLCCAWRAEIDCTEDVHA